MSEGTSELMLKVAEPGDLDVWMGLRMALWPDIDPVTERAEMARMLTMPDRAVLLAFLDGMPVGVVEVSQRQYAEGCATSPVGYLEGWYVDPSFRTYGIGRQLVLAAESWARAVGCREMASDTEVSNAISRHAHAQLGFEETGQIICFRKTL